MADVSCRMFEMYERAAEELGIPAARLLDGTTLSLEHVRDPKNRAPWDEWVVVCQNLEDAIGGPEAMRRWGHRIIDHDYTSTLRGLAGGLLTVPNLYRASTGWMGPVLYPHLRFDVAALEDGRMRICIDIPAGYRGSAAWFRLVEGTLVVLPRMLNAPDAQVTSVITERRAEYFVLAQTRRGRLRRSAGFVRAMLRPTSLLAMLYEVRGDLDTAYRQIQTSEQDLRRILDELPDPVVITSNERVRLVNRSFRAAFLNPESSAPLGRMLSELVVEEHRDKLDALLQGRILTDDPELRDGLLMLHDDGRRIATEPSVSTRLRFEGADAQVLVLRDVTERRQLEAMLALTERVSSLGTMAAGMAHDINNPLTAVVCNLELIEAMLVDDRRAAAELERLRSCLAEARTATEQVAGITRDLIRFPGETAPEWHPIRVEDSLDAMIRLAKNEIRHRARLVTDYGDTPLVESNYSRLGQVFLNLLLNAARAIPVGHAAAHTITVRTYGARESEVVVEIVDTGCGMSAEQLERAFEPFFTTKPPGRGTGLGLSVCRRIVEAHGGRLELESEEDRGTTARVTLPAARPGAGTPVPEELLGSPRVRRLDGRRLRILVVDDDPRVRDVLGRMLDDHDVRHAASGREALKQIAGGADLDLLLCDIMMPDLTGPKVHEQVREAWPDLARRFVFMTGGTFTEDTRAFVESVDLPVISKPFRMSQLARLIEERTRAVDDE